MDKRHNSISNSYLDISRVHKDIEELSHLLKGLHSTSG